MKTHSTIIMDKGQLDFRPFKAWRYNTRQVELSHVIAPPYDVISGQDQESLYAKSPYNVVRLILGKEPDFHDQAEKRWVEWRGEKILTQNTHPAFYLYEQTFSHPLDSRRKMKRFALVGVLNLEKADSVLLHEATFAAPRKDRLLLLEKTHTNLSPVFGLYRDSKKLLPSLFASYEKKPKLFEAQDDQGSFHKGWAIEEGKDQVLVQKVLASEKILIADGHHRFETALEYRRQMREKFPNTPREAPFDFVLMALVEFDDPGLLVLPTHRIIRSFGKMTKKEFIERLRPYFDFLPYPEEDVSAELTKRSPSEWVIGVLFGEEGSFLIKPRDFDKIRKALPQEKPPIWYQVDVNLLTYFVFGTLWEISGEERESLIEYTRSAEEALKALNEKRAEAAFLIRPTEVGRIWELADVGEKMPQKTTYFYPKLASGLFFYHHGN